ncbi:predicted protein [Histoplasma mississippiense (nom. inval.)]|uniref:predicted protein n=1 Tax=Ajellomyces capsulatus (strain NAm1 / WU24) TaxID=2059318 RepID=UPI000157C898|nr:predicted protein [Histoplasma mississippiense (nom. inval.)]EDN09624.1 predicted protein [Histoplasma mississippiense (nom. inval.)]
MYKNRLLRFQCIAKETKEEISISCIGGSEQILRELLSDCRAEYLKRIQKKTTVFEHHDGEWRKAKARDIRPISTVIMDEDEKIALLKDIEGFLDERAPTFEICTGLDSINLYSSCREPVNNAFSADV